MRVGYPRSQCEFPRVLTNAATGFLFCKRRLRRGQPRDRHAEWAATDVIQADLVAELDRVGFAAVLAANANLEVSARLAATFDAELHQAAHAVEVNHLEGVFGDQI